MSFGWEEEVIWVKRRVVVGQKASELCWNCPFLWSLDWYRIIEIAVVDTLIT